MLPKAVMIGCRQPGQLYKDLIKKARNPRLLWLRREGSNF